ncbi:hypothetical protein CR513_22654, partial [Mucuna pruriens]
MDQDWGRIQVDNPATNATPVEGNQDEPDMNWPTVNLEASTVEVMTRYPGQLTRWPTAAPGPEFIVKFPGTTQISGVATLRCFQIRRRQNPTVVDRNARVLVWVFSVLGRDRVLLLGHGLASVEAAVL